MEKRRNLSCGAVVCWVLSALAMGRTADTAPSKGERKPLALRVAESKMYENLLTEKGYKVDTPEQIQEALKSPSFIARMAALYVLTNRMQDQAIGILKGALKDQDVRVRTTAGDLLGALGDKSAIPVLRHDLATLAPRNGLPDPNLKDLEGRDLERASSRRTERLWHALGVSKVLSRMGDPSGLELAARMALHSDSGLFRQDAITVLTNLATSDRSLLGEQSIDPESVLIAMAEVETKPTVLRSLRIASAKLRLEVAKPILEKLAASPHLSAEDRETARRRLEHREWKARRQSEAQSAEPK